MYGRILVAIDESETSDIAFQQAVSLAKDQKAALQIVHAIDLSPVYLTVDTPYPFVEYEKAMRETGEKLLADRVAKARLAGVEVDTKLITIGAYGERIYDVIEEQAKEWRADLIVIGTHGRRGARRMMLGSVAEGLIRVTTKPVLLIRSSKKES
jgi:nucleotide-binding universal stress UspA family protein